MVMNKILREQLMNSVGTDEFNILYHTLTLEEKYTILGLMKINYTGYII